MQTKIKTFTFSKHVLLFLIFSSAATLFLSCQPTQLNSAMNDSDQPTMGDIHKPPGVMEQPEADSSLPLPPPQPTEPSPTTAHEITPRVPVPKPLDEPAKPVVAPKPLPEAPTESSTGSISENSENKKDEEKDQVIDPPISEFIRIAHEVMVKEGKQIGTPCNFYLRRVLVRAGFKNEGFGANDFDVYAKENFLSYKSQDFKLTRDKKANELEQGELKRYIDSYPVRTPFILQWTRPIGKHGHVAIVERYDENTLVIYQASLNRHSANRKETTIKMLLTTAGLRSNLTVYSEFKAKK